MKDIITTIHEAFSSVNRPSETMSDAEVADEWGDESKRFEENDTTWWEIPDEVIADHSTVFCYLSPEAKLYYLPAYMSWFLRRPDMVSSSNATMHLLFFLSDIDCVQPVWIMMTEDQKKAMIIFADSCNKFAPDQYIHMCGRVKKTIMALDGI